LRARLANVAARFLTGPSEAKRRQRLWRFFVELTVAARTLATTDGPLADKLDTVRRLSDRAAEELAALPPPAAAPSGAVPAQFCLLALLSEDLEPLLVRWRPRLAARQQADAPDAGWPLREICRRDLAFTQARLVARARQLAAALDLPSIDALLPEAAAAVPALTPAEELDAVEAEAAARPDPEAVKAGWRIYVAAVSRLPPPGLQPGGGCLGEAIAALQTLADEVRTGLQAMPPTRSGRRDHTIEAQALRLLSEVLTPFLLEWRPRYGRFVVSKRSETKWGRAAGCRTALAETRERALPIIGALGRNVGAPPLLDSPLRLPPP
jgi:hypothetical protein